MKVGIITSYYPPHTGGVEVYATNIARCLAKQGRQVFVITTGDKGQATTMTEQDGLRVYRLGYQFKISNTPIHFLWRRSIERILAHEQPDVINAHTPVPYLADIVERLRGNIPFVLTYHNDIIKTDFPLNVMAWVTNFLLMAGTLKRAEAIITTSEHYARHSPYLRRHAHKISVVPPGVDGEVFNDMVDTSAVRMSHPGKRLVLFVGSLKKSQAYKGLEVAIRSLANVKKGISDAQLVVAGDGNGKQDFQAYARRLGVAEDVVFVGKKSQSELAGYYAAAEAEILPSTNATEGFGMVLIEAGACATPVIGSNIGGIPVAINDGVNGLLVPPGDDAALSAAITKVMSDPDLAKRLGKNGAKRARELFNWDTLAAQTGEVLAAAAAPTIAHVAGYYPPHLGGMEKVAQALAERLADDGYDTRVITSALPTAEAPTTHKNLRVERYKAFEFAHTPIAFGAVRALFNLPRHSLMHLHLAQAFYPELVWLVGKLRGMPYIVHFHLDLMPSGALGRIFLVYKAVIIRAVIRGAAKVAVFSAEQQQFIHSTYGVPLGRIVVIPNGVDEAFFAEPKTYSPAKQPATIVYAGRLSSQKRVDRLIAAVAVMQQPATLTIIGDGELRSQLETQAKHLKNVTFVGYKTPKEMRSYFAKADVFAITSEREGMPLVVLEAMAAGLPIIGTNVTGIRELVKDVGVLVNDPSPTLVAAAIDATITTPGELTALSAKSIHTARAYTWQRVCDDFKKVYTEVAK